MPPSISQASTTCSRGVARPRARSWNAFAAVSPSRHGYGLSPRRHQGGRSLCFVQAPKVINYGGVTRSMLTKVSRHAMPASTMGLTVERD